MVPKPVTNYIAEVHPTHLVVYHREDVASHDINDRTGRKANIAPQQIISPKPTTPAGPTSTLSTPSTPVQQAPKGRGTPIKLPPNWNPNPYY